MQKITLECTNFLIELLKNKQWLSLSLSLSLSTMSFLSISLWILLQRYSSRQDLLDILVARTSRLVRRAGGSHRCALASQSRANWAAQFEEIALLQYCRQSVHWLSTISLPFNLGRCARARTYTHTHLHSLPGILNCPLVSFCLVLRQSCINMEMRGETSLVYYSPFISLALVGARYFA